MFISRLCSHYALYRASLYSRVLPCSVRLLVCWCNRLSRVAGGFSGARDEGQGRWGREPQAPSGNAPGDALEGGPRGSGSGFQLERGLSEQRGSLTLQPRTSSSSAASDPAKPKVGARGLSNYVMFACHHPSLQFPACGTAVI